MIDKDNWKQVMSDVVSASLLLDEISPAEAIAFGLSIHQPIDEKLMDADTARRLKRK